MQIVVKTNNIRIDKYLSEETELTRSQIAKMIDNGAILVNNKPTKNSYKTKIDDLISIDLTYTEPSDILPVNIPLDIIYEDDDLMIINKPSGLTVHPGSGNNTHTLVNALLHYTNCLSDLNGSIRPGIVHRIDKDTSGILLVAKNNKAHALLSEDFKNKKINRQYIALLTGILPNNKVTIDAPIGRDPKNRQKMCVIATNSKEAITHATVIKRYQNYTLVSLKLETGRTHQIRVHTNYIGHPVYNDPIYTNKNATSFGQFLHSSEIEFYHPITKEYLHFTCPLPPEFQEFLNKLDQEEPQS